MIGVYHGPILTKQKRRKIQGAYAEIDIQKDLCLKAQIFIHPDGTAQFGFNLPEKTVSNHVVPGLFGSGTQLFEQMGSQHIPLKTIEVIQTKEAIHQRFRVVK